MPNHSEPASPHTSPLAVAGLGEALGVALGCDDVGVVHEPAGEKLPEDAELRVRTGEREPRGLIHALDGSIHNLDALAGGPPANSPMRAP